MLGPYKANKDKTISYKGNKVFKPIKDVRSISVPINEIEMRVNQFDKESMWEHLAKINHRINISSNKYFEGIGALFTILPLTTRMISSPGAIYGKNSINYTADTCPITLRWFDLSHEVFLSESSQIYLELALVQKNIKKVYSIYNSFRKENSDMTHLSEFHHIEFEGKLSQKENEKIALGLIKRIVLDLLKENRESLSFFLTNNKLEKLEKLEKFAKNIFKMPRLSFKEVLFLLYKETGDARYNKFSLECFGTWEEIKITEILKNGVIIKEFPLLEVPFYHTMVDKKNPKVANNSDFIWPGYREVLGSGQRIQSKKELQMKAKIFNLPLENYSPYLQTRKLKNYKMTSGFGLGWERFIHGMLEMPYIWSSCQFPRVNGTIKP